MFRRPSSQKHKVTMKQKEVTVYLRQRGERESVIKRRMAKMNRLMKLYDYTKKSSVFVRLLDDAVLPDKRD